MKHFCFHLLNKKASAGRFFGEMGKLLNGVLPGIINSELARSLEILVLKEKLAQRRDRYRLAIR